MLPFISCSNIFGKLILSCDHNIPLSTTLTYYQVRDRKLYQINGIQISRWLMHSLWYFSSQIPASSIFCFMFSFLVVPWQPESWSKRLSHWQRCLHDGAQRWTWSLPLAGLQSFQACTGHWSAVYGPVLQSTNGVVEVERWHAAEGTGGGNCFPSICRPRVTLAICSSRNALYSLNTCQRVLLFACCTVLYTHDGGMRVIQYYNNIVFYIDPLLRPY